MGLENIDLQQVVGQRCFVVDCPGCPCGLTPPEQVEWALTQPFSLPSAVLHPLQKAAVADEVSRPSSDQIDEERLDLV